MKNSVLSKQSLGIYIHIPFCKSRCIYCDFVSSVDDFEQRQKYTQYLCKQIVLAGKEYAKDYVVDTLYFGGGTPTLLEIGQLKSIIGETFKNFNCNLKEFSIEANPCSVNKEKLLALKELGVTRLSIGVQSFNDNLLKMLGRRHNSKEAQEVISLALELGFDVSVDAMIGLPNQTKEDIKDFVYKANKLGAKHISVYMLSIEEGTQLKCLVEQKKLIAKTDDELAEFYEYACKCLKKCGFERYEISNFYKNNKVSHHNLRYWKYLDYLGLGMSAHSFTHGERWQNSSNFDDYYQGIDRNDYRKEVQLLSKSDMQSEYIMLAFRLQSGIDLNEFSNKFGNDFSTVYANSIVKNSKYLDITKDKISIKEQYLQLMNSIIIDFI